MKSVWGKAPRSPKASELLKNRDHARQLFYAIKALPLDAKSQVITVAGISFRSDAPSRAKAAND